MLQILSITVPIYIVIALGYLAGRFGLFSKPDLRVLGRFVVNFALPALLFTSLSQQPISALLNVGYLAAYVLGSLTMFFGGMRFARRRWGKPRPEAALCGMGMSCSNSGYIGYPIALQLLGPPAAVALAICMVIENLLMLPLILAIADSSGGRRPWYRVLRESALRLARNPVIGAIVAGIVVSSIGLTVSPPLARTVNMLALSSTALALFVIGGSLVGLQPGGMLREVTTVALSKLLLHPIAVFLWLLPMPDVEPKLQTAAVVFASVPMLSIFPILAHRYEQEGFAAAALLVATTLSFVTITLILSAMNAFMAIG